MNRQWRKCELMARWCFKWKNQFISSQSIGGLDDLFHLLIEFETNIRMDKTSDRKRKKTYENLTNHIKLSQLTLIRNVHCFAWLKRCRPRQNIILFFFTSKINHIHEYILIYYTRAQSKQPKSAVHWNVGVLRYNQICHMCNGKKIFIRYT